MALISPTGASYYTESELKIKEKPRNGLLFRGKAKVFDVRSVRPWGAAFGSRRVNGNPGRPRASATPIPLSETRDGTGTMRACFPNEVVQDKRNNRKFLYLWLSSFTLVLMNTWSVSTEYARPV